MLGDRRRIFPARRRESEAGGGERQEAGVEEKAAVTAGSRKGRKATQDRE